VHPKDAATLRRLFQLNQEDPSTQLVLAALKRLADQEDRELRAALQVGERPEGGGETIEADDEDEDDGEDQERVR
jgi:hypothetical protein